MMKYLTRPGSPKNDMEIQVKKSVENNKNPGTFQKIVKEDEKAAKEKAVKENFDIMGKHAVDDFKEWEKQLAKQEKLLGPKGQQTRQFNQILSTIKQNTVPSISLIKTSPI